MILISVFLKIAISHNDLSFVNTACQLYLSSFSAELQGWPRDSEDISMKTFMFVCCDPSAEPSW